jgi:hypothetical protein
MPALSESQQVEMGRPIHHLSSLRGITPKNLSLQGHT